MVPIFLGMLVLCPSWAEASATVFRNETGWTLFQSMLGALRAEIKLTSADGQATYAGKFILVNDAAQFQATLTRAGKADATVPFSFSAQGTSVWIQATNPPPGFDPSGEFKFQEEPPKALMRSNALQVNKTQFHKADAELNQAYQKLMGSLDAAGKEDLKTRQKEWIEQKDYLTDPENGQNDPDYWDAVTDMTKSRTEFLKSTYPGKEVSASVSGTYADESGGVLSIREAGGEWQFAISVVRGPTFHTGFIRAAAKPDGKGGAKFVDADKNALSSDGQPAIITFQREGKRIVVTAANTDYYHGARAYFEGTYFKVTDQIETFPSLQQ